MPENEPTTREQEMEKAQIAYAQKRYGDAHAHLKAAKRSGAATGAVQKMERVVKAAEEQQSKLRRNCGWVGFLIALFAYGLLAFLPVSLPVRYLLMLGIIPAVCGFAIGRLAGYDFGVGSRFRRAARIAASTMFGYALLGMIWTRTRFEMGSEAGQIFLVWLSVAAAYALIAGLVAGIVGAKLAWPVSGERKERDHGTAS